MPVNSGFRHNALIIVRSLRDGESDTARRLYEHLETYCKIDGHGLELIGIRSRADFFAVMQRLIIRAQSEGLMPIVHFEAHGHEALGLEVAHNQYVSWEELVGCLRPINVLSGGNLVVGIAACHGFHALAPAKIDKASPFYAMIGPSEEVEAGLLETTFQSLYEKLFVEPAAFSTMAKNLPPPLGLFHAEAFFTRAIAGYFESYCMGKSGAARRESFISKGVSMSDGADPEVVPKLRKIAKETLRPNEEVFNQMAERFIVDRGRYKVTFQEVMALIESRSGRI